MTEGLRCHMTEDMKIEIDSQPEINQDPPDQDMELDYEEAEVYASVTSIQHEASILAGLLERHPRYRKFAHDGIWNAVRILSQIEMDDNVPF